MDELDCNMTSVACFRAFAECKEAPAIAETFCHRETHAGNVFSFPLEEVQRDHSALSITLAEDARRIERRFLEVSAGLRLSRGHSIRLSRICESSCSYASPSSVSSSSVR